MENKGGRKLRASRRARHVCADEDQVRRSIASEGGRVVSSDRLRRQGRIARKLVASRREARTLAELNGDMRARADMMHGCGIGGANHQQAQGAQNQSGTHRHHSVSNEFPSCAHARPRSQGASASRPVKSAGSWGGIGPAKITFAEMCEQGVSRVLVSCADYRCSRSLAPRRRSLA